MIATILGGVFRVDPVSGDRTLFSGSVDEACSSIHGEGPVFSFPFGITVVPEPGRALMLAVAVSVVAAMRRFARSSEHP